MNAAVQAGNKQALALEAAQAAAQAAAQPGNIVSP